MTRWTRHEDIWDEAAAAAYDTPGTGMFDPGLLAATADRLASLAEGGRVIELAIGTGRVAIPLLERGLDVAGIEIAPAMIARLRQKVDAARLPVVQGDMTTAIVEGRFSLALLVFNGISNVETAEEQAACFRNAARHLEPGGRFVIELWVPQLPPAPPAPPAMVVVSEPGYILVDTIDVVAQHVVSHHFRFGEEGTNASLFRSSHRYVWPDELDSMAETAGFVLESRHADWHGAPFTAASTSHVSVYRLAA